MSQGENHETKFSQLALIAAIGLAAAGTSYAHEDYSEAGTNHWLSHVSESKSAPTANQLASFGYAATKMPTAKSPWLAAASI